MIERVRALVGAEGVRVAAGGALPGGALPGDTGGPDDGTATLPVLVAPDSAEAAAAVLRVASMEGWRVRLAGDPVGVTARASAAAPELVLTTERMAGIVAHEPADLVVTAGAGTTLGALQSHLASAGQWFPLDPPGGAATTLGALVAGAKAGPLREGYGTPRDQVLGLQLVTGDGRIVECGGRVVKNVAGYDLVRLLVGSRGTLGLVTRVDLRLRALPGCDRTLAIGAGSPALLLALVDAIRAARIEVAALELISPAALESISQTTRSDVPRVAGEWLLLVRVQGNAPAVAAAAAEIERVAAGLAVAGNIGFAAVVDAPWEELSRLEADAAVVVRLADRPAALAETLELALRLPGVAAGEVPLMAHAGAGIVRALLMPERAVTEPRCRPQVGVGPGRMPQDGAERAGTRQAAVEWAREESTAEWARALHAAGSALAARRGTLRVCRARGGVPGGVPMTWLEAATGVPPSIAKLQHAIRERFDPAGVLLSEGEVP